MISPDDMTQILGWMQTAEIRELTVREGQEHLRLKLDTAPDTAIANTETAAVSEQYQIKSPGQGHFLSAHPRRAEAKVENGDPVAEGQIVAYLKAGNTFTAITASVSGTVTRVLVNEGDLLGYASPVIEIERSTEACK